MTCAARCGSSGCSSRRRFSTNFPTGFFTYATSAYRPEVTITKLYARRRDAVGLLMTSGHWESKESSIIERPIHLLCRGVAQPGSAPALGAGGRRFESYRPDHSLLLRFSQLIELAHSSPARLDGPTCPEKFENTRDEAYFANQVKWHRPFRTPRWTPTLFHPDEAPTPNCSGPRRNLVSGVLPH